MVPKALIVLFLPPEMDWLGFDEDKILIYGKGFWMSLKGRKEGENHSAETIYLTQENRLTVESIRQLMISAANREDLAYVSC